MSYDQVPIAETFYSVQGEGPHAGTPAVFLRLAGCNLCCGGWENLHRDPDDFEAEGDASWVCDTIDVWRAAERLPEPDDLAEGWKARGWLQALSGPAHLVLTGGEPTIAKNQKGAAAFFAELAGRGVEPFIEVETNGTEEPMEDFGRYIDHWNVSLKLSNSGMEYEERINEDAIDFYKWVHESDDETDAIFKFVVSDDEDAHEVRDLIRRHDLPDSMITLMPAGQTQDELRETYETAAELCKSNGWRFSPRLQVDAFGDVTGV